MSAQETSERVAHLLRELAPQVLGALSRHHADFTEAEDAVQEGLIAAAVQWSADGIPVNPAGWLFRVAQRRLTDLVRSEVARRRREDEVAAVAPTVTSGAASASEDDSLLLLFMCCHPALTPASAIALTLRAVGGLTTGEIAKAFLVPETTMAQRISRAKQTIRASGIPFAMPAAEEYAARLRQVLHVIYLIFNEGYTSSGGADLQRTDLAAEAIRLARALHERLPADPEVEGLLALMLLTDARRAARTGTGGELIPLDEQDRSLWDHVAIAEGSALVAEALARGSVGPYQVQGAIAALHGEASSVGDTDWPQIAALYSLLVRMTNNPMAALSGAVATAMCEGVDAGFRQLEKLAADPRLVGHYRLDAVRGHMLEMSGDRHGAADCFRAAAERTASVPERNYLLLKAARLKRQREDRS